MTEPRSGARVVLTMATPSGRGGPMSPVSIHGLHAWDEIAERCSALGWSFEAVGWASPSAGSPRTVLWDFGSIAVRPSWIEPDDTVIAWSLESPLVAHRAYHRLDHVATASDRVLSYPGVAGLLPPTASFTPVCWPNRPRAPLVAPDWASRPFAAMVNSNKDVATLRAQVVLRDPYWSARRLASTLLAKTYRLRGKWSVPNLYLERLAWIELLATTEGFDLYGTGWDSPPRRLPRVVRDAISRSYRGTVPDKAEVLSAHRFGVCIENTRFPGYVSEKLFDCLFAGTIPVYLGAPDITTYVPKEAYVRIDAFPDREEVLGFLLAMSPREADAYLSAGRDFLASRAFDRFTEAHFVNTVMDALGSEETSSG